MTKKIVLFLIIIILLTAAAAFFFYKQKDPECDAAAKEATKEQFFQKGPYERAYQDCLKRK